MPIVSQLALLQAANLRFTADELATGIPRLIFGVVMAVLVYRLVRRVPWPRPFRLRFAVVHMIAAPASALAVLATATATTSLIIGQPFIATATSRVEEALVIGVAFYAIIAGVSYAMDATARAARTEAAAARMELGALRAQFQPHFLFNALHTVVQLIPREPDRAVEAAELVAALLRTTLDEPADVVPLGDEWEFVTRYLELERIRFGDRLRVSAQLDPELLDARVPTFVLQTLVENAVRHGAAPRVAPTDIVVTAEAMKSELTLTVRNPADAVAADRTGNGAGTGLKRLAERLALLHGSAARLVYGHRPEGGFEARVVLPRQHAGET